MKKILRIFKGCHYPFPLDFGGFLLRRITQDSVYNAFTRYTFYPSCKYEIGEDQSDVNKLFGLSLGNHHNNSIRIGWRYLNSKLEICYYAYKNGKRIPTKVIHALELMEDKPLTLDIGLIYNRKTNEVNISVELVSPDDINIRWSNLIYELDDTKPLWSYGLGLYFGGNRKSPHTIKITRDSATISWR